MVSFIVFIIGLVMAIVGVVVFGLSGQKTKTEKLSEIAMYVGVAIMFLAGAISD